MAESIIKRQYDIGMGGMYVTTERNYGMEMSVSHSTDCAAFISLTSKALPRYLNLCYYCLCFLYDLILFNLIIDIVPSWDLFNGKIFHVTFNVLSTILKFLINISRYLYL